MEKPNKKQENKNKPRRRSKTETQPFSYGRFYHAAQAASGAQPDRQLRAKQIKEIKRASQNLAREFEVIRKNEPRTVDGQYTARFSGVQSGLAAGPRGATVGGLRPIMPAQFFKLVGLVANDLKDSLLKREQVKEATKETALESSKKTAQPSPVKEPVASPVQVPAAIEPVKKAESPARAQVRQEREQLRAAAREMRDLVYRIKEHLEAQKARDPFANKRAFQNYIPPGRGPMQGGWGSI